MLVVKVIAGWVLASVTLGVAEHMSDGAVTSVMSRASAKFMDMLHIVNNKIVEYRYSADWSAMREQVMRVVEEYNAVIVHDEITEQDIMNAVGCDCLTAAILELEYKHALRHSNTCLASDLRELTKYVEYEGTPNNDHLIFMQNIDHVLEDAGLTHISDDIVYTTALAHEVGHCIAGINMEDTFESEIQAWIEGLKILGSEAVDHPHVYQLTRYTLWTHAISTLMENKPLALFISSSDESKAYRMTEEALERIAKEVQ